jgi:hypothetical protein
MAHLKKKIKTETVPEKNLIADTLNEDFETPVLKSKKMMWGKPRKYI